VSPAGFVSIEQARGLPGLRLVVLQGLPSPWSQAAKAIFRVKRLDHRLVHRLSSDPPGALEALTGQASFPAAMYEDERPRSGWAEILWLAERLAPKPALVPADPEQRALLFGLAHEICGEMGLGWCRRLEIVHVGLRRTPDEIALPQRDPSEMSVSELRAYIGVLRRSGEPVARYVVQLHFKLAVPLSAALFALLAVPVGLRPHRSGTSIGLGLTVLVLIGYYIISAIALPLGESGRLHPIPAAWAPNIVLAATGLALLRRADR